jgi:PAS domain S-box-containing protein
MITDELNTVELNALLARLRESEARLEDFLENVGDLIMMTSVDGPDGRIIYANRAWKARLGYDEEDLKMMCIRDLFRPEDNERMAEILERLKTGESIQGLVLNLVSKDGVVFPAEGSVSLRFQDGKPVYSRVILRDITERLKIEQMKNEAVSLASHELRQPLCVIKTALDAIGQFGQTLPVAKADEFLQMARRNTERLAEMVDVYLDLAKLESGAMELKSGPVELSAVIERVVADVGLTAAQRGVRCEMSGAREVLMVVADPLRLTQVLTNLLSNAVKFSPAGEAVTVYWTRQDGEASVSVADRGPGISREFRSRIFGKFAQERRIETSGATKGTGLGLSIAKAIVERLGGRIWFETKVGEGTTFRFTLPVSV